MCLFQQSCLALHAVSLLPIKIVFLLTEMK